MLEIMAYVNQYKSPIQLSIKYITNCQGSNVIVGLDVLIGVALRMHAYH